MRRLPRLLVVSTILVGAATAARATDIAITGLKLIVVDKTVAASSAKAVFVSKDLAITKGTGTDPGQIASTLDIAYDAGSGAFDMPQGSNWLVNSASVGKYVNKTAPTSGATKVSVVKPGSLVKVVGKSLGDAPLDISTAPSGTVYVADTVVNGAETIRLCTQFTGCVHKTIAGNTGYKLVCKGSSTGDPACMAANSCVPTSGTFCTLANGTIYDSATGLQWEKKTTTVGSGVNALDLHDVDNPYQWSGTCSVTTSKYCQPNLAAETACKAQTAPANWVNGCEQCVGGEGTCTVTAPALTTVWDWLSQMNTATYARHNDWRLPSEDGRNTGPTADPRELETILPGPYPVCGASPCIPPIFGPTVSDGYWSSAAYGGFPTAAWGVDFTNGFVNPGYVKSFTFYVRAVRGGS